MYPPKKNSWSQNAGDRVFKFTQILTFFVLCFFATIKAGGETNFPEHDRTTFDLNSLQDNFFRTVKRASDQGFCSPDFYDAGVALQNLIFNNVSGAYKQGDAGQVWGGNQGVKNFFKYWLATYPEMSADKLALIDRLHRLDLENPVRDLGDHGPALTSTSQYNAYEEALKITKGNVFRAVTLVGNIGHDDVTNFNPESNLYSPNSIGVTVPPEVTTRFSEAGRLCEEAFPDPAERTRRCSGAGSSFNYHVNFGFFLGCYFAKKGFGKASISKIFADGAVAALNDPFLEKSLAAQEKSGRLLNRQYQVDLCTDVPKLLGYFYKRTTMPLWLSEDSAALYAKGYRHPFQFRDPTTQSLRPKDWTEARWQRAVANLDYRLMHLEYGSKQSEVGAKRGAEVCASYAADLKPNGLSPDAETLYKRGNYNPNKRSDELVRVPESLKSDPTKLDRAWEELKTALRPQYSKFDYDNSSPNAVDPTPRIQRAVDLHGDRDIGAPFKLEASRRPASPDIGKGIDDLTPPDFLKYLDEKASRTTLTKENAPDAERSGEVLAWAVKKFPSLRSDLLSRLTANHSDFTKFAIFSAFTAATGDSKVYDAANQGAANATDPLLTKILQTLGRRKLHRTEATKLFLTRIKDIDPTNVPDLASLLLTGDNNSEQRNLLAGLLSTYAQTPNIYRTPLLTILAEKQPTDPKIIDAVAAKIKSGERDDLAMVLKLIQTNPTAAVVIVPELTQLQKSKDSAAAERARQTLSEWRRSQTD